VALFLRILGLAIMVGPATVDFLMGNRWYLPPRSLGFLLLLGACVSFMGASLAKDDDPRPALVTLAVATLLLLLFWWLGWFYAAVAVMLVLGGVLWWLERRSKSSKSAE
jgi:hypothetical protein